MNKCLKNRDSEFSKKNIPFNVKIIKRFFPRRFIIAKLTKIPLIKTIIDKMFFEDDEIYYLPKNNIVELNTPVTAGDSFVLPSQILEHFIDKAKHLVIMDSCICRESSNCQDYDKSLGCLFLGEAAQRINPNLGKSVSKEQAYEHLKKCRENGLVHLIGRNKLDSVWLKVKPGEKLLTICNCCPCCCLWLMIPHLSDEISKKIKRMPGVKIYVNNKCIGCKKCISICFVNAIAVTDGKAHVEDNCRGCGRCIDICPENAIELILTDSEYLKKTIDAIDSKVSLT